jgi:hypothetical protein
MRVSASCALLVLVGEIAPERLFGLRLDHFESERYHWHHLKANGYATSWFGKDHNTPSYQATQAGPFDRWPIGMGFDYFYGFVGGDASQWLKWIRANRGAILPVAGDEFQS